MWYNSCTHSLGGLMKKLNSNKWNLKKIYPTVLAWEKDFKSLNNTVTRLNKFKGQIKNSANLLKVLQLEDQIDKKDMKLFTYAFLNLELNKQNAKFKNMLSRITNNSSFIVAETAWLERDILSLPSSKLKSFANLKKMKPYSSRLDLIIKSKYKYSLSKKEERVFNLASGVFNSFNEIRSDIEINNIKFPKVVTSGGKNLSLNHTNITLYDKHSNRDIRRQVYLNKHKSYLKNINSFTGLLKGHVQSKVIEAKMHNYKSPVDYMLEEECISRNDLDSFVKESFKGKKFFNKYFELKRKKLKLRKLKLYDIKAPSESIRKISYSDASKWFFRSIEPFGDDYGKVANKAFKENWIDSADTVSKKDPATAGFSFNPIVTHPHVFLTYQGDIDSVMTLAHEVGHAIHGYNVSKNNSFHESSVSFVLAESIAFTNEMLVLYKIINESRSKPLKNQALWKLRDMFYTNIYQTSIETEFELQSYDLISNNKKWNQTVLCKNYKKLEEKYLGESVDLKDSNGCNWSVGDAVFNDFYSAKYLIAFCLAVNFVDRILEDDDEFIYRYNKVLKMGDKETLQGILNILDVNLDDISGIVKNTYLKFNELLEY
jgi:oligoendopeptidase F